MRLTLAIWWENQLYIACAQPQWQAAFCTRSATSLSDLDAGSGAWVCPAYWLSRRRRMAEQHRCRLRILMASQKVRKARRTSLALGRQMCQSPER